MLLRFAYFLQNESKILDDTARDTTDRREAGDDDVQSEQEQQSRPEPPHVWFYEGHNGWWQYDERTSAELEAKHSSGAKACEVLVAGYVYRIDLEEMVQSRRDEPARKRRIKRDRADVDKKGIAGIRIRQEQPTTAAAAAPTSQTSSSAPAAAAASLSVDQLGVQLATQMALQDDDDSEQEEPGGDNA